VPLSYSRLQLYRRCPRQFEYACVKKIPRQISAGESFGSSAHNALKKWGELEIQHAPKTEDQLTMFSETSSKEPDALALETLLEQWHQSFIIEGYESRVEADSARQRGEKLMKHFYDWWKLEPRSIAAIEKGFKVATEDTEIGGRFDRVEHTEDGVHIIDYKTGAARSQNEVDADLQLSIYALAAQEAFGKPCTKLTLLFLYEDELIERVSTRSQGQLADAKKQIHSLYENMQEQDFHPTPSKEICRHCPYKGVCDVAAI